MRSPRDGKKTANGLATSLRLAAAVAAASVMLATLSGRALAAEPGATLNKCQATAAGESAKYVRAASRSLGKCLKSISKGVLEDGDSTDLAAWGAGRSCLNVLRRFVNSSDPSRQLSGKLVSRLDEFCDPSVNPDLAHTDADVWSTGPSAIGAGNLGAFCQSAGGDGNVKTYGQWRDCVKNSVECQARQLVASQWPRALEYLAALRPAIARQPAGVTREDALSALDAIDAAIEGPHDDNMAEIACGRLGSSLRVTGQTQCDQGDGTLGDCASAPNDDDAKRRAGRTSHFVDNGDGTISDLDTGLMWEKLSDDDSEHDMDRCFRVQHLDLKPDFRLNPSGLPGGTGFAGYGDWRAPTRAELETLVDAGRDSPAIDPIFNHDCTPGCSVTTCSCTNPGNFLTSTPDASDPRYVSNWAVNFSDGSLASVIGASYHVRGVRGGRTRKGPPAREAPVALDVSERGPWRSSCVPIHLRVHDSDSRSIIHIRIIDLPVNGFLTRFRAGQCNTIEPDVMRENSEFYQFEAFFDPQEVLNDNWDTVYCYVTFSPTFLGTDSFTYRATDSEFHDGNLGTVEIEIFEVR